MKEYALIGCSSGIGLATAKTLLKDGHKVWAYARNTTELEHLSGECLVTDLDLDAVQNLEFPESLDGLAYFPGTINLKPFKRLKREDWVNDYMVNVIGAAESIRGALDALKNGSRSSVVLFSSVAASTGMNFHSCIAAAKAGVEGLAKSLAAEFAPHIRFNVISPSLTDTPLAAQLLGNEAKLKASTDRHPLKSVGQPQDVAEMVRFLFSDSSKFMTGQVVGMDGGIGQTRPL